MALKIQALHQLLGPLTCLTEATAGAQPQLTGFIHQLQLWSLRFSSGSSFTAMHLDYADSASTAGVCIPDNDFIRSVCRRLRRPLALTSTNITFLAFLSSMAASP